MTSLDLSIRFDRKKNSFWFENYDQEGYPYFRGYHLGYGHYTISYDEGGGFWLFNRKRPVTISRRAWKWKPFIPDDGNEMLIIPGTVQIIRDYNKDLQDRYVPGEWKNIQKLNRKGRKRIMNIYKWVWIWGNKNRINIPPEIFFLIMRFVSILIPQE